MSIETIYDMIKTTDFTNIDSDTKQYDKKKIIYCIMKLLEEVGSDECAEGNKINRNDYVFKEGVKARFNKCIICRNDECLEEYCEVAHILDFSNSNEYEKYDIDNGLYMCANYHILFDKHLLKLKIIDYDKAFVSLEIDEKYKDLKIYELHGLKLQLFSGNMNYINKRYQI
jgi:predicted restriction endonuclease